ncbi:MAG: hypothetical protein A2583_14560 [Bdellovibrionales bacterium RIFOXYD1_FULL_53_11]|nr:MAG: hypothetical protein A2583_14560 [Bdellovibrionales bacterium RIFOXYD1_FULL_53_11]
MYSDSNLNAGNDRPGTVVKLVLAGSMLAAALIYGADGWTAGPKGGYSREELSAVQTAEETSVSELRAQEITQLRIALGRRSPANRMAELYFRLAKNYLEAYSATFKLEGRVHEKHLERGMKEPYILRGASKPYLALAVKASNEIIGYRIAYDKLDQVHFFLAFAYKEMERRPDSRRHFSIIVRSFPSSQFAPVAYRELGEMTFADGKFRDSISYLETATRIEKGENLPRILHKLAWSYYRTKQYARAVGTMKRAIAEASKDEERLVSLREEALRDIAIFMTETGRVEEAVAYFDEVAGGKTFYGAALEKLAKQYERSAQPVKAAQVYEALVKAKQGDGASFRAIVKLVEIDIRRGRYSEALARARAVKLPDSGDSDTATALGNLRALVRKTATGQHENFRKKKDRKALSVAESYYTAYLGTFLAKEDPRGETPEIMMYLAEVKRENKKPAEASELYRKVLESKDKRYAKQAGTLWTASLAESMKAKGTKPGGEEPSAVEKEFVDAADRMRDSLGLQSPESREAALKSAQVLAGYKNTKPDAVKRAREIINTWPQSPQAHTAAKLWLQTITDRMPHGTAAGLENSDAASELRDAMAELRSNAPFMAFDASHGGKLKQQMAAEETRLKVGAIATQEKEKNFGDAGRSYETFAAEAPSREIAEKAFGNAVSSYIKEDDMVAVDRVIDSWLKRYPGSAVAADAARGAATAWLIKGYFENSGALFEKAGRLCGDADSLDTAARIFEGIGQAERARSDWGVHLSSYKKSSHHWAVAIRLARSFEDAGNRVEAVRAYKFCMTGFDDVAAECGAKAADVLMLLKDSEQAVAIYRKVAAAGGRKKGPYVGYARYKLAAMQEATGRFEPLRLPEKLLGNLVNKRIDFFKQLDRAYSPVVDAGGPWAVAALDRLALWAWKFADEMDALNLPEGADAKAAARFRLSINSISVPLRKKAAGTWMSAFEKAVAAEALSPALPSIADHLADARVAGVWRAQGSRGGYRLAGIPPDGGSAGRAEALGKTRSALVKSAKNADAWVDYGNLLWGEGRSVLARLAYERALALDPKNIAALVNRAVIALSGDGAEDWTRAAEAQALLAEALKKDNLSTVAKINRAQLLNYYRVFSKSKTLWEQAAAAGHAGMADVQDGLGVALQGTGALAAARAAFEKAGTLGAPRGRFANVYHEAAAASTTGVEGAEKCLGRIGDINIDEAAGFEKDSAGRLKRACERWANGK